MALRSIVLASQSDSLCIYRSFDMSQSRLFSSRVLDESSSDDDDEFIIGAAQIIQSVSRRKPGVSYMDVCTYIEIEKLGTLGCFKNILQNIPHMAQLFFDEGKCLFIFILSS
jgi:hypothetical protein